MHGLMAGILAAHFLLPMSAEQPVERCLSGPHEPGRIRRLPITPMTSAKPRNPHEDAYPPCPGGDEEIG